MRDVHQRARIGIRTMIGRQGVLQLLAIAGGIVVARILGPARLGVFGIALFPVGLAALVADLGTRTALIRRATPPTERELGTCLALQQSLATVLVLVLVLAAPRIAALYHLAPPDLVWMLRLLAFDLYLRSWRALSEVRLERELRYRELAVSDVIGSVGYQVVSVGMLLVGYGVWSLVWATLIGSLLRAVFLYRAAPWPVRPRLDPAAVRELVRVGLPLQASYVIGLAPTWITPTLVAGLLGPEAVGLVTWASVVGRKPIELLENVVRVSVSHVARLQDDLGEVERILVRYVVASVLVCGLWFAVLASAGHDLVTLVYGERWLPALPVLCLYAATAILASVRRLAWAALVGLGRVRFTAKVSTVVAIVAVGACVVLVPRLGIVGVPLGQLAGIALATPWLLRGIGRGTLIRVLRAVLPAAAPIVASIAVGSAFVARAPLAPSARGVVAAAVMAVVYAAVAWATGPRWLRAGVREEIALPVRRLRRDG